MHLLLVQDFKRLVVWHKAHALFLGVNAALALRQCRSAPWLRTQALRAAASIAANIAEGCGKTSAREFARYIEIAIGSARELENHLILARDIGMISGETFRGLEQQLEVVRRMLIALGRGIRKQTFEK